jgi:hypothetical protein
MSKSLYSLILNDEVVSIIDKMARVNGLSRSNMIEKILANAVSYETPEIRANNIFDEIEKLFSHSPTMRYLESQSQYMGTIVGALDYRYNPAIKYNVELFPNSDKLGQLKVTLRTQNNMLLELMSDFYKYYIYLEKTYYNKNATYLFEQNRFIRLFDFPSRAVTTKQLAELLTIYVKHFDELLNVYFNNLTNDMSVFKKVERKFIELKSDSIII